MKINRRWHNSSSHLIKRSTTLPPSMLKLLQMLKEYIWVAMAVMSVYLFLILISYQKTDAAWSHSGEGQIVQNYGGLLGAWCADVLLYSFGMSTYLLIGLLIYLIVREHQVPELKRRYRLVFSGFSLLFLANTGLETAFFYTKVSYLPLAAGGFIGTLFFSKLSSLIGVILTTIFFFVIWGSGFSLLSGYSWVTICETIGEHVEETYLLLKSYWDAHYAAPENKGSRTGLSLRENLKQFWQKDNPPTRHATIFEPPPASALLPQSPSAGALHFMSESELSLLKTMTISQFKKYEITLKIHWIRQTTFFYLYEVESIEQEAGRQEHSVIIAEKIEAHYDQLLKALNVLSIRVVPAQSEHEHCFHLQMIHQEPEHYPIAELLFHSTWEETRAAELQLLLGKDEQGCPYLVPIKHRHLMIISTKVQNRNLAMYMFLLCFFYHSLPKKVRLVLIDHETETIFDDFNSVPFLAVPVITKYKQVLQTLRNAAQQIYGRMKTLERSVSEGRSVDFTHIVIMIADPIGLIESHHEVEQLLLLIAQKGKETNIHLILGLEYIEDLNKSFALQMTHRLVFQTESTEESMLSLRETGAETLLPYYDCLYKEIGSQPFSKRLYLPMLKTEELDSVLDFFAETA